MVDIFFSRYLFWFIVAMTKTIIEKRIYRYRLIQDGVCIAAVESTDKEYAEREIKHYAFLYGQDGPVEIVDCSLKKRKAKEGK